MVFGQHPKRQGWAGTGCGTAHVAVQVFYPLDQGRSMNTATSGQFSSSYGTVIEGGFQQLLQVSENIFNPNVEWAERPFIDALDPVACQFGQRGCEDAQCRCLRVKVHVT